jgi:hypothetical protein
MILVFNIPILFLFFNFFSYNIIFILNWFRIFILVRFFKLIFCLPIRFRFFQLINLNYILNQFLWIYFTVIIIILDLFLLSLYPRKTINLLFIFYLFYFNFIYFVLNFSSLILFIFLFPVIFFYSHFLLMLL